MMKTDPLIDAKRDAKRNAVLDFLEGGKFGGRLAFDVNRSTISTLIDMTENGEVQIQVVLKIDVDEYGDDFYQVSAHLNSPMQLPTEAVLNLVLGRFVGVYGYGGTGIGNEYYSQGQGLNAFVDSVSSLIEISSASAA